MVIHEGATVRMLVEVKRLFRFHSQERKQCKHDIRRLEIQRRKNETAGIEPVHCAFVVFDVNGVLEDKKSPRSRETWKDWLRQQSDESKVLLHIVSREKKTA
jgi:hypothetical protein